VRDYWNRWWEARLQPVSEPLGLQPTSGGSRSCAVGGGVNRRETVLRVQRGGIYLLTTRRPGLARLSLDGEGLALVRDPQSRLRVARLLLEPGDHVLRMDGAPEPAGGAGVELLRVGVSHPGDIAVFTFRPVEERPAPAAAFLLDDRFLAAAPGVILAVCLLVLLASEPLRARCVTALVAAATRGTGVLSTASLTARPGRLGGPV
jgi:hypothetical protein